MARLANKPKYYWDACAWIALIQREPGRFENLEYILEEARASRVEIWTSNFTLAEVYKRPCNGESVSLSVADDEVFEDFILQDFVERVQVDYDVGVLARRLLRAYPSIVKPQDGIHLATALLHNIDELHTYDRENLLDLTGKIQRKDGITLVITRPHPRPTPVSPRMAPAPLLDRLEQPDDDESAPAEAAEGRGAG